MARSGRQGFSLIELMVVMIIMAILLALFVPTISSAWRAMDGFVCRNHLSAIYQAHGTWRAEQDDILISKGRSWVRTLAAYAGGREDVFRCPCSGPSEGAASARAEDEFEFDVYSPEAPGSQVKGRYRWSIALSSPRWVTRQVEGDAILYKILDAGHTGTLPYPTSNDLVLRVHYQNGCPGMIDILIAADSQAGGPLSTGYLYDFKRNGKVIVENWEMHLGETFSVADSSGPLADYGLNTGAYNGVKEGENRLDPRVFLMLDYPRSLVEYVEGNHRDDWGRYFIDESRLDAWLQRYGNELEGSRTWRDCQALRHDGRANVMFCDGHVETFDAEALHETSPLWRQSAR